MSILSVSHPQNIVLIGLMGSGKTTVGRLAAQSMGFEFVDTDHVVMASTGKTIPEIFALEGETGFRRHETQALQSLLSRENTVIATGGGIVTQAQNRPLLKQLGFVVWLDADPARLYQRTARQDDRPLLKQGDAANVLRNLHESRSTLYADVSDLKITTDDLTPKEVAYGLAQSAIVHFRSVHAKA